MKNKDTFSEQINVRKLDNGGFTLVEMTTTFVLLGIFLVAVTRLVSYTITLYHETQGAALGMQVSDMIATRIQSEIEASTELVSVSGNSISIRDRNDVKLDICEDGNGYMAFNYEAIPADSESGFEGYDEHTWKFDRLAYMGYAVKDISFSLAKDEPGYENLYDSKVVHMEMTLSSDKYGEYTSNYYMRAFRAK